MPSKSNNLTQIPTVEFHDSFFHKDEFHSRGMNYTDLANYIEVFITTDHLQEIIDENWNLEKIKDHQVVISPEFWDSFTNKLLGSRLNPYGDSEDAKKVIDLTKHREFIIYLKSLDSGYLCSMILYNKGYLLDDDSTPQPFSELPEYFTGEIFSLVDVINYLITGKAPAPYNGEIDIPEKLIMETKTKLEVLKEEFTPFFENYKEDASDPDWVWADWKMRGLNIDRHELIFNIMMDHHIAIPGWDANLTVYRHGFVENRRGYLDGNELFKSISHCKNPIIKELYSNWII